MLQLLEQRNLPDGGGGDALLLRLEPDLLHGDDLARLLVAPLEVRLTARVITHSSQLELRLDSIRFSDSFTTKTKAGSGKLELNSNFA